MRKPSIFIAATNQHEGKTTACLGILSGFLKRYNRVGFIKPVGQQHITTSDCSVVDKDVVLFKKHFPLEGSYRDMSPIIFTKGYTKDFIDGKIAASIIEKKIVDAYNVLEASSDCMLVEGTGNVAVGSIAEISNARVASLLGIDIVLVTSGGIGSAFDLIALNKALCDAHKVRIKGVILNRVLPEKREMIHDYMSRALKRWDIPLLGCIPFDKFLSYPSMQDFETLFETKLLSGHSHRMRHFTKTRLVATSVEVYEKLIQKGQLIITPSSREDIVFATLRAHWDYKIAHPDKDLATGFIFTGSTPPSAHIVNQIIKADIPMLYSSQNTFETMQMISGFTAKIQTDDTEKIHEAIDLMERHIDINALLSY